MPVSLARRIRRIGLMPSTKDEKGLRIQHVDPFVTDEDRVIITAALRAEAKRLRLLAFPRKTKPALAKAA